MTDDIKESGDVLSVGSEVESSAEYAVCFAFSSSSDDDDEKSTVRAHSMQLQGHESLSKNAALNRD